MLDGAKANRLRVPLSEKLPTMVGETHLITLIERDLHNHSLDEDLPPRDIEATNDATERKKILRRCNDNEGVRRLISVDLDVALKKGRWSRGFASFLSPTTATPNTTTTLVIQ